MSIAREMLKPKKRGRLPPENEPLHLRLSAEMIERLDDWRRNERDLPGRQEAIRRLLDSILPPGTKGPRK